MDYSELRKQIRKRLHEILVAEGFRKRSTNFYGKTSNDILCICEIDYGTITNQFHLEFNVVEQPFRPYSMAPVLASYNDNRAMPTEEYRGYVNALACDNDRDFEERIRTVNDALQKYHFPWTLKWNSKATIAGYLNANAIWDLRLFSASPGGLQAMGFSREDHRRFIDPSRP